MVSPSSSSTSSKHFDFSSPTHKKQRFFRESPKSWLIGFQTRAAKVENLDQLIEEVEKQTDRKTQKQALKSLSSFLFLQKGCVTNEGRAIRMWLDDLEEEKVTRTFASYLAQVTPKEEKEREYKERDPLSAWRARKAPPPIDTDIESFSDAFCSLKITSPVISYWEEPTTELVEKEPETNFNGPLTHKLVQDALAIPVEEERKSILFILAINCKERKNYGSEAFPNLVRALYDNKMDAQARNLEQQFKEYDDLLVRKD